MSFAVVLALARLACAALELDYTVVADASAGEGSWGGLTGPESVVLTKESNFLVILGDETNEGFVLLDGGDLTLLDTLSTGKEYGIASHPDGRIVATDEDANSLVFYETTATTVSLESGPTSISGTCTEPDGVAVRQTGNQQIVVACAFSQKVCTYDGTTNQDCTSAFSSEPGAIALTPDDSAVYVYLPDDKEMKKFTITDSDGTLTAGNTLNMQTATGNTLSTDDTFKSMSVLSDGSLLAADFSNGELYVVNSALTSVTSQIDVDTLYSCSSPSTVTTTADGTGDIIVACDGSNTFLALDNTRTSAETVSTASSGVTLSFSAESRPVLVGDGFTMLTSVASGNVLLFGSALVGVGGDPVIVDVRGHHFLAGHRPSTDYLLYASGDSRDTIVIRTGTITGAKAGYFIDTVTWNRSGCGSVSLTSAERYAMSAEATAPCMDDMFLVGDNGLVAFSLSSGTVVYVLPHHGNGFEFLNVKFYGRTDGFAQGCRGMLCDEKHADSRIFLR